MLSLLLRTKTRREASTGRSSISRTAPNLTPALAQRRALASPARAFLAPALAPDRTRRRAAFSHLGMTRFEFSTRQRKSLVRRGLWTLPARSNSSRTKIGRAHV